MLHLTLDLFKGSYSHLNGSRNLPASKAAIARSMITLGYGRRRSAFSPSRFFRILEYIGITYDCLQYDNGNLELTDSFRRRVQSDKTTASYNLGMALTKLFAEKELSIPWLLHLEDVPNKVTISPTSRAPKHTLDSTVSHEEGAYPDLIGYDRNILPYAFEAKGYSSGYRKDQHQKAINQVSQVVSINGTAPEILAACFFDLSRAPIEGHIIDPEPNQSGTEIGFSLSDFFREYYGLFDSEFFKSRHLYIEFGERIFPAIRLFENFFLGIDQEIYRAVMNESSSLPVSQGYIGFQEFLSSSADLLRKSERISLGQDGILLVEYDYLFGKNRVLSIRPTPQSYLNCIAPFWRSWHGA